MNAWSKRALIALLSFRTVVLTVGCETLHHHGFTMEPIENYGGGGGDGNNG
jgi:hypothetical protein